MYPEDCVVRKYRVTESGPHFGWGHSQGTREGWPVRWVDVLLTEAISVLSTLPQDWYNLPLELGSKQNVCLFSQELEKIYFWICQFPLIFLHIGICIKRQNGIQSKSKIEWNLIQYQILWSWNFLFCVFILRLSLQLQLQILRQSSHYPVFKLKVCISFGKSSTMIRPVSLNLLEVYCARNYNYQLCIL